LLPRHRGASPIAAALLAGDLRTGITIMRVVEEMDAGDILLQQPLAIFPEDTTGSLTARLAAAGGDALREACTRLRNGGLELIPQDATLVTYAPRLTKEDGRIHWTDPAAVIERKVRAFTPWPSAFTSLEGRTLKVLTARVAAERPAPEAPPGTIVALGDVIRVATGDGAIDLLAVQAEGRRPIDVRAFLAGARLVVGTRLDAST
jgi:methionyl-tRNA formyltransferase